MMGSELDQALGPCRRRTRSRLRLQRRWPWRLGRLVPWGACSLFIGLVLAGLATGRTRAQTYEIRRLAPPADTFRPGETAALSPLVVNNRGEILIDNAAENSTSTRQKGAVMARWSVGAGSAISYRRIVASVAKNPSDLTWNKSALTLVDLADDGTALGWETYEGLENATWENAGADRVQELGLFHDLVVLGPDGTVPRRLGMHTYVRQLWNNVIRTPPVAIAVNNRGSILGRYRIYHRFDGTEHGGDFVGALFGRASYLRESPRGGASDLNDRGEVIGVLPGDVAAFWSPGFRPLTEVIGYSGSGKVVPAKINNQGEIAGQIAEAGNISKLFLWLPRASYGLGAGLHTLFTVTNTSVQVFDLNDNGALLWTYGTAPNNNAYLWSERRSVPLRQAVPSGSPLLPIRTGVMSLNDLGWISGWAVTGSGQEVVPMVMRPVADAEALLSTNRVRVGEVFTFRLRLRNHLGTPATLGLPIGFRLSGNARFELAGNPSPPAPRVVPAYGSFEIQQPIRALAPGSARWFSQGRLITGGTTNDTLYAYAESIRVLDRADLLIKRGGETDDRYGLNDEYQTVPTGRQVRTNHVTSGEVAEFNVRVQNDDTRSRTFRIRAEEGGASSRWEIRHLLGAQEISATVRGATGHVLPELGPGAVHALTLRLRGTNAVPGDVKRVIYTLEDVSQPGETADAVEAVTALSGSILVNSTGDESDSDPYDGVADVDLGKPGLQTTLRAAIEFANARPGRDRIEFGIAATGNLFEGGVPVIRPRTGLPRVQESVVIDGWTQNPASATPPVVLNGSGIQAAGDLPTAPSAWREWNENPAAAHGLHLIAGDCLVTGLVIQQFPLFGIRFEGEGQVIEGNFIGTDATGSSSRANGMQASLDTGLQQRLVGGGVSGSGSRHRIGGVGARSGNLLSGLSGGYLSLQGGDTLISGPAIELQGDNNEILGNWIGVDRTGDALIGGLAPSRYQAVAGIIVSGNLNRIGGPGPGEGNVIMAVWRHGMSILGDLNRVLGNHVGLGDSGRSLPRSAASDGPDLAGGQVGIEVWGSANDIGGLSPGEGNRVGHALTGVVAGGPFGGDRTRVYGNRIGLEADGRTAAPLEQAGIRLRGARDSEVRSNTVANVIDGNGIEILRESTLEPSGTVVANNRIFSVGQGQSPPNPGLGAGILVESGRGHRLTGNLISDTQYEAIQLHDRLRPLDWTNDEGDTDEGPNRMQNHPVITRARWEPRQGDSVTELDFILRTTRRPQAGAEARYGVEFYVGDRAGLHGSGEAAELLLNQTVPIGATGEYAFTYFLSQPKTRPGQWITATATDPDGNTSMLSPAVLVQGPVDDDADAMSDAVEDGVPGTGGPAGPALAARLPARAGDGNGDGIPDSRQAGVASFPSIAGPWLTLIAPAGASLREVRPMSLPQGQPGPEGIGFPVGWVEFGVSGLVTGSSVEVTLLGHGAGRFDAAYGWGSSQTTSRPQGMVLPTAVDGEAIRVTCRDGGPGDRDAVANGVVRVQLGLARGNEPGPALALTETRWAMGERSDWQLTEGRWGPVVRPVPIISGVLSWPAHATNWWPEQTANPANGADWSWVTGQARVQGDRRVVPHEGPGPVQFFRLRRRP